MFTRQECRDIIIGSFKYCQKNKGLIINAYVVMSSHIQLICRAEEGSEGLSDIIRDFKKFTSMRILDFILTRKIHKILMILMNYKNKKLKF